MREKQIKKIIADHLDKGKGKFPKCEYVNFSKNGKVSDEISNRYGRFDIVAFSPDSDTYYLIEAKEIGEDNKRIVSLGQVFGQAIAYQLAIEADPLGFSESCMEKFGAEYSKYLARFQQNKLKFKVFIGVDNKDDIRLEFIHRLVDIFKNKVGAIVVNEKHAKIISSPEIITLKREQRPTQILKIFGKSPPNVKKLVSDLAREILRMGPTIQERERTDRWCACAKTNFVEFFKREHGAFIQFHTSSKKRFDGKINYTRVSQKRDLLKKIRKSLNYCQ